MKRVLVWLILLVCLCGTALAGSPLYIANPNPADRLHLRTEPNANAKSLGKYYNGAPIERTDSFNHNGWVKVKVGLGARSLTGYMKDDFLSSKKPSSAMPQYAAVQSFKAYVQPDKASQRLTVAGGSLVSLMGFGNGWWHVLCHTASSEGNYTCFVPANAPALSPLLAYSKIPVYVSNPDPTDRLHLRTAPDKKATSLGKYYNGVIGELKGFANDGFWVKVDLYGREGYMMTQFVTIEGAENNTYYGIPEAKTTRQTKLYRYANLKGQSQSIPANTTIEVYGVMEKEQMLHVCVGESIGYMCWSDTSYIDPK